MWSKESNVGMKTEDVKQAAKTELRGALTVGKRADRGRTGKKTGKKAELQEQRKDLGFQAVDDWQDSKQVFSLEIKEKWEGNLWWETSEGHAEGQPADGKQQRPPHGTYHSLPCPPFLGIKPTIKGKSYKEFDRKEILIKHPGVRMDNISPGQFAPKSDLPN